MHKLLFKWLKIPAEPEPPAGSHESVQVFRAAKNFYYLLLMKWGIKQVSLLVGILFSLYMLDQWSRQMNETLVLVISVFEWIGVAGYLCQIPLSLALVKLDYELRWRLAGEPFLTPVDRLVRETAAAVTMIASYGACSGHPQEPSPWCTETFRIPSSCRAFWACRERGAHSRIFCKKKLCALGSRPCLCSRPGCKDIS